MAIAFIANALGATNSTTSFSITLPTTAAGDILICEFSHRGTGNGTIGGTSVTIGGLTWTLKHSQLFGASAFSGKTYWTRATGDHAGQTVTGASLTNSCAAILTQYRGALAAGDPLADATIVGEQNASGNETQAQIVTATDGAMVVLVVVNSPDLAVATQACTSPGTLTERAERLSTGGTDASIAHASEVKTTAGGTGAFTWTQTNAASGSWAYAIKPANVITIKNAFSSEVGTVSIIEDETDHTWIGLDVACTGIQTVFATGLSPVTTPANGQYSFSPIPLELRAGLRGPSWQPIGSFGMGYRQNGGGVIPAVTSGFDFPSNSGIDNNASVRFRFTGAALIPIYGTSGAGVTYLWKYRPRQQTGYYTCFFWGNDDGAGSPDTFTWDSGQGGSYYGAHPFPADGTGFDTNHLWEIAVENTDETDTEPVVKDVWYSQAVRAWGAPGVAKQHEYYWNLPELVTAKVTYTTISTTWGDSGPPAPALTFADAPWNPSAERASGVMRGWQIYNSLLTTAQINILEAQETDADVLAAIIANSIPGLWYLNMNPVDVNDISDKSGAGHHPTWWNANRPTHWTG